MMVLIFIILFCFDGVLTNDKNSTGIDANMKRHKNDLIFEYDCNPPEKWELIKNSLNEKYVKDVCISVNYQIAVAPNATETTEVSVVLNDIRIGEIDEKRKSITLHIEMWCFWEDDRIKVKTFDSNKPIFLTSISKTLQNVWTPFSFMFIKDVMKVTSIKDPVISDIWLWIGKSVNTMLAEDVFLPNATVVGAFPSWDVKIFCNFDFSEYPFDHQICPLGIANTDLNVTIFKKKGWGWGRVKQLEFGPYDVRQKVINQRFWFDHAFHAQFSYFGLKIHLTRQLEAYIYQCYLPCNAVVIISFLSFFIPLSAIPGRVAVMVTQILTLTSIFIHQMGESPSESKLNRLGVYLLVSLFFVFATMIEFAFVLVVKQKVDWNAEVIKTYGKKDKSNILHQKMGMKSKTMDLKIRDVDDDLRLHGNIKWRNRNQRLYQRRFLKELPIVTKIDYAAFIIFFISYFLFNIIYFAVCLKE